MKGAQFARELRLAFSADMLWADIVKEVAPFARQDRDATIRAGEFSGSYDTLVNGREGAAEETLQPGGAIVYRARSLGEAVAMALDYLRRNSPERTTPQRGNDNTPARYRDSFMVGISRGEQAGRAIPAELFDPARVSAGATEAFIYNLQPYSRLVDVQLEGGRRIQFSIEPGLFNRAAAYVRRAYPALQANRIYDLDFPGKYRPKNSRARAFQSPGLVIRA